MAVDDMRSNAAKGAYYKSRTKKWLEAGGYQVADLETVRWVYPPNRDPFPVKRDQFGSDLLAMTARSLIFVQVKGGATVSGGNFPAARRAFAQYHFPAFVQLWVIAWPVRSRAPRIVKIERTDDAHTVTPPAISRDVLTGRAIPYQE